MAGLVSTALYQDLLWKECRFCDHLARLSVWETLRDVSQKESNEMIRAFAKLESLEGAYEMMSFLYHSHCYISLENRVPHAEKLKPRCYPKGIDFEKVTFVRSMWVDPSYRRSGMGTAVLNELKSIATELDYSIALCPRSFELKKIENLDANERSEQLKIRDSEHLIGNGISGDGIDEIYNYYAKQDFIEYKADETFKIKRGMVFWIPGET